MLYKKTNIAKELLQRSRSTTSSIKSIVNNNKKVLHNDEKIYKT